MTEQDYNNSLMIPIQFSMAISKIAVEKASHEDVAEFAGIELAEATAISTVLKDLGTLVTEMDEETNKNFDDINATPAGRAFDELYISWQLKNHQFLRDLAEDYLNEAPTDDLDTEETQGKHLAMLMLPSFEAHIIIAQRLEKTLIK